MGSGIGKMKECVKRIVWSLTEDVMLMPLVNVCLTLDCSVIMNAIIWNCRGTLKPNFQNYVRELVCIHNPAILVVMETRIGRERAKEITDRLPFENAVHIDTIGLAGGLWMLWNSKRVEVMPLASTEQEIHAIVKVPNSNSNSNWLLSAIYASPRTTERHILWNNLIKVAELHDMPWVLVGDFNEPLTREDKFGGRPVSGDRNTTFYHVSTLVRRKRNQILAIKDSTGDWIHEENGIKDFIRRGFEGVYTSSLLSRSRHNPLPSQWQAKLSEEEKRSISGAASEEEIKSALWLLKPFKVPGLDGLHAGFFQRFWLVVGKSVLEEVKNIFAIRKMPEYLNRTHIALIPKVQGHEMLGNYRPISLCNTIYKIVTKIIVARLRPFLDKLISLSNQPLFRGGKVLIMQS
ncbi:uncharacterized protein LOC142639824 [Castanea sativa]|uniref:uncharacterized protein LOC142639824 n=1 Tax=Castanea sativa TaxID=21020 RepID=UPI003F652D88